MSEKEEISVNSDDLKSFTRQVFVCTGLPQADAELVADVLVWANLRGIDSHGVLRIAEYTNNVDIGFMNPNPDIQILKETQAITFIEADHAFGPVVTMFAMKQVIKKAKEVGIGWALIRNTTHQGAMGYYVLLPVQQEMAGIASVASPPTMSYYGSRAKGLSPAPIAISVPAKRHNPLLLDMATAVVAFGKIFLARDRGVPIPEGWALDKDGNPTTDPNKAAMMVPFGGPKGSGLSLMLECLSGVMADNPRLEPNLMGKEPNPPNLQNSFVAAIDISQFTGVESYKEHIDNLIDGLKALPKAQGFSEIFMPGELEDRICEERKRDGIPLPQGTVQNLRNAAEKYGVELPTGL
jgi:ureidoglycolate dehydrogenase (NAD+)